MRCSNMRFSRQDSSLQGGVQESRTRHGPARLQAPRIHLQALTILSAFQLYGCTCRLNRASHQPLGCSCQTLIGNRFVQLAATNSTHGGHHNTRSETDSNQLDSTIVEATVTSSTEWRYTKNLVNEKRFQSATLHSGEHWVRSYVAVGAEDSPNQAGRVFTLEEFRTLLTSEWTSESEVCLADWLVESFCAKTFMLGALRTEQMNRFRAGGLQSTKMGDGKCEDGKLRPFVISKYKRVKNRNATSPSRLTDEFELVIPCLCDKEHQPIDIEWDNEGNPVGAVNGNVHCWFGLFDYLTKDLHDPTQKLIQNFNTTEKKFGRQNRSDKKIKKTIGNWCKLCGVSRCSAKAAPKQTNRAPITPGLGRR